MLVEASQKLVQCSHAWWSQVHPGGEAVPVIAAAVEKKLAGSAEVMVYDGLAVLAAGLVAPCSSCLVFVAFPVLVRHLARLRWLDVYPSEGRDSAD